MSLGSDQGEVGFGCSGPRKAGAVGAMGPRSAEMTVLNCVLAWPSRGACSCWVTAGNWWVDIDGERATTVRSRCQPPGTDRSCEPRAASRAVDGGHGAAGHAKRCSIGLSPRLEVRPSGTEGAGTGGRFVAARRHAPDAGAATPLSLLLGMAFVVLPVMVLVLSVPTWEQRAVDAQDAARAAARALASATSVQSAESSAGAAVQAVMEADGLAASQYTASLSGELVPGATVRATVSVEVPIGELPGLGAMGDLHYTASSTAHVDSYEDSTGGGGLLGP